MHLSQPLGENDGPKRECQHCGFPRVPLNAPSCPNCGKSDALPGVVSSFAGRGTLVGAILGCVFGAVHGYFNPEVGVGLLIWQAFCGLVGGVIVGMAGGLVIGEAVKLAGVR
jgi:hypothetical protein